MISVVGLDGDDTLWHNERLFAFTQQRFRALLAPWTERDTDELILSAQRRNLALFGYGIKAFTLSLIETAIELSNGRIEGGSIQQIIDYGKEMLSHPVAVFDDVRDVLQRLQRSYRLALITKGDLLDQESKLARSGLSEFFSAVEIVSEKDEETYTRVLARLAVLPQAFLMVGNSLRSDVLPVVSIGGHAVHIPHDQLWALEHVTLQGHQEGTFHTLAGIAELPGYLDQITHAPAITHAPDPS